MNQPLVCKHCARQRARLLGVVYAQMHVSCHTKSSTFTPKHHANPRGVRRATAVACVAWLSLARWAWWCRASARGLARPWCGTAARLFTVAVSWPTRQRGWARAGAGWHPCSGVWRCAGFQPAAVAMPMWRWPHPAAAERLRSPGVCSGGCWRVRKFPSRHQPLSGVQRPWC